MRENESDGEGGWAQPPGYGQDDPTLTRWAAASPAPPPPSPPPPPPPPPPPSASDYPDTVAFGTPAGYPNQAGAGYGGQPGYRSQAGYGNQESSGWYAGQGGHGDPGGDPADGRPGGSRRGGRLLVYVVVAALAASIGAGATVALNRHHDASPETPAAGVSSGVPPGGEVPAPHDNASGSGASSAPLNAAAVAQKVDPGLVDITATLKYNGETAEGTGMIISADGLVLTNNHVIDQATKVQVNLVTQSATTSASYSAKVLGYDAADDVALLKLVGASGLPVERFGNSSQVSLGTPVLALGNAEGHGGARPAQGIINALDRSIQASDEGSNTTENLKHMLQTNAKILQGDSGGALANNAGQVIGMITAANTGGSHGPGTNGGTLGFAIPINSALSIARQIAAGQPSATIYIGVPGFLGVEVATSDSESPAQQAADEIKAGGTRGGSSACQTGNTQAVVPQKVAPIAAGALIVGVLCDTAADAATMVPGDVITAVNGQVITTPGSLTTITTKYHPNDVVSVLWVSLDGAEHSTRMQLGQGPARLARLQPGPEAGLALGDLRRLHVLAGRVRDLGDAGPVVHRGDAERGEPGHVGPAELGPRRPADRRDELGGGGMTEARPGAVGHVEDRHRPPLKYGPNEVSRLLP
jgi:S1-C subfamily serine protease